MITVVIPTIGRPSLRATLGALSGVPVVVADDRPGTAVSLEVPGGVRVVRSGGRGPAAARNAGWRVADTPWVAFLDDDVVPSPGWVDALWKDLVDLPEEVAGSQGRIVVPLPSGRRPTDGERHTAGLAGADWPTADMAYRRSALERAGGFDERFPRAYREDADLALRMRRAGYRLVKGARVTVHPVRDDGFWASVRFQRGNADDALMRRLHGPAWRAAIGGAPGRLRRHALTTALAAAALTLGTAYALTSRTPISGKPRALTPHGRPALTFGKPRLTSRGPTPAGGALTFGKPRALTSYGRPALAFGKARVASHGGALTFGKARVLASRGGSFVSAGDFLTGLRRMTSAGGRPGAVARWVPGLLGVGGGGSRRRKHGGGRRAGLAGAAGVAAAGWAVLTGEFVWARVRPGPRDPGEVARMAVTSVLIPPVACWHRLRGEWEVRR